MIKLTFTAILMLCFASLRAQDVTVSVTSGGTPLGYAYVYVNGKMTASASDEGVALLPRKMLHLGDTISASFIGMGRGEAVYGEKEAASGRVQINIEETQLDGIVVRAKRIDTSGFFRKYVHRRNSGDWYDAFKGNFRIRDNQGYMLAGSYERAYLPGDYIQATGEKTVNVHVKEEHSDTIHTRADMLYYLSYFFGAVINAGGLNSGLWYNRDMVVQYQGRSEDTMRFFISRPVLYTKESFQTILSVDAPSKEVVVVEGDFYGANEMNIRFKADYAARADLNMVYPTDARGSIKVINGRTWYIDITDIEYDQRHKDAAAAMLTTKKRR